MPEQPETQVSVRSETAFLLQTMMHGDWFDRCFVSPEFKLSDLPPHTIPCRVVRRMLIDFVEQE